MNAKNQKASSGKSQQHMSDETFRELKESFEEALAHARGKEDQISYYQDSDSNPKLDS